MIYGGLKAVWFASMKSKKKNKSWLKSIIQIGIFFLMKIIIKIGNISEGALDKKRSLNFPFSREN